MPWKVGTARMIKYLSSVEELFKRAFKLDYCNELFFTENIVALK